MRQQLRAGPTVAVLAGQRSAESAYEPGRFGEELAHDLRAVGLVQRQVEPHVHAPVAEVTEGCGGHAVGADELVEGCEVLAEASGRHGRVLPSRPGRLARRGPPGEAGAVLADAPEARLHERVLDDDGVVRESLRHQASGACGDLAELVAGELDEQPGTSAREWRDRVGSAAGAEHVDEPGVQAFAGRRPVRHDGGGGLAGRDDVGETEDDDDADRCVDDQLDARLRDDPQGPLGAHECLGEVEPLGQQVVRRVARDLPAEPVELGAPRRQVPGHHRADPGEHVVGTPGIRHT